jgi:hypothetical protein
MTVMDFRARVRATYRLFTSVICSMLAMTTWSYSRPLTSSVRDTTRLGPAGPVSDAVPHASELLGQDVRVVPGGDGSAERGLDVVPGLVGVETKPPCARDGVHGVRERREALRDHDGVEPGERFHRTGSLEVPDRLSPADDVLHGDVQVCVSAGARLREVVQPHRVLVGLKLGEEVKGLRHEVAGDFLHDRECTLQIGSDPPGTLLPFGVHDDRLTRGPLVPRTTWEMAWWLPAELR